ncbi:MAG: flagellin [Reinekea sp.]|nr:flagellin [Reinekea sp.]
MPQIINTNIASLNAQRNLNASQRDQESALQRLSSGLRINSAKDDAAGLAISTRFDSQIRGTSVAVRNSGDAISLAQTAEGALDSINTSLQRIRELALQSANDTNTTLDRQALQEEVDQLISEIQSVAESANFNGKKLLDGSFQNAVFQTGANVGDTITVSVSQVDADSLGVASSAGISSNNTANLSGTASSALVAGDIVINGVAVSASVGSSDNASQDQKASSAIAKAAAINSVSDQTGVTAVVNENVLAGTTTADATAENITIAINGVSIELSKGTTLSVEANLEAAVEQINNKSGQTGVVASFTGSVADGITLTATDGRNITLGGTAADAAASFGLAATGSSLTTTSLTETYVGTYTLVSESGGDINITSDTGNIDNAGFEVGTFSGVQAGVVSNNVTATTDLASGDLTINGVSVGPSSDSSDTSSSVNNSESAIAKAAAINAISDQTNVTAIVNENRINGDDFTITSSFTAVINGVSINISLSSTNDTIADQLSTIQTAINNNSGQTGVTAELLDADTITLVAADGRNISIGTAANAALGTGATLQASSITLVSGGSIEIGSVTGNSDVAGFRVGTYGNGESGTALKDLDISTVAGAEAAVLAADNAINTVATVRAELGAVQNRFQNTIANLEVSGENLSAANSRIRDADFAQETAELSRSQVLQQAGISVLAQANARPQQVLSLLQ